MNEKRIVVLTRILVYILLILFISMLLSSLYYYIQRLLMEPEDSLLFLNNNFIDTIFIGGTLIIVLLGSLRMYTQQKKLFIYNFIIKYSTLLIISIVLMSSMLIYELFDYSIVKENGVYVRPNIFSDIHYYKWNEIESVDVGYYYTHDIKSRYKIQLKYNILMIDGRKIDIFTSNEFWEKVVEIDRILIKNDVRIKRAEIDRNVDLSIIKQYTLSIEKRNILRKFLNYEE